ncbi:hypothetical protein ES319_D07G002700v1 [Gossypium barbadense]|uniref:Cytochrome P450 n=1 Tax=Gossypium barbadense TaxID=3634 RepID=A0A5J5QKM4_GOSBA|nr:hypothetical protein ES319_D07G002700v1 [Gossypium barbadense]PPD68267.1 hypothetical protein GOBAR_DD34854 [Gossypium barbadense]
MEVFLQYWLKLVMICLMVLVLVLKIAVLLWWRPKKIEQHFSRQGIKGPPYHFYNGNVKEVMAMMLKACSQPIPLCHNILPRVFAFYHHWNKIYGGMFLVWFGPTVRVTVSDPDMIREILSSKSELYEKKEVHHLIKRLEGDGLLSLNGEKWGHHRETTTPIFHMENLKLLVPMVVQSVSEMVEKWRRSRSGEIEIEVCEWFQRLTEDVIMRTVFGSWYEDDDGKAIFRLQAQQMVLTAQALRIVSLPAYRYLPTKRNISCWKMDREIKRSLMKLIERRKIDTRGVLQENAAKDLVGLMMQPSSNITVDDMVEECKTFLFAGKHTTSNLLTWTTVLLAMHPQWQVQAREEVIRVCGSRDVPTKDDVVKLKTLTMILNESLRLYPPTIATIRQAKVDVKLGDYIIPRGTELLIPILALHHDQAIWGSNANEFYPPRFSGGVARAAKHPLGFIPFGLGVRTCIGKNLAILQAKLTLSIILQRFSFKLAPTYQHAPTVSMLLYPQHGAPIIFKPLSHRGESP